MHDIGVAKTLIVWDKTRNSFYHKDIVRKERIKKIKALSTDTDTDTAFDGKL